MLSANRCGALALAGPPPADKSYFTVSEAVGVGDQRADRVRGVVGGSV